MKGHTQNVIIFFDCHIHNASKSTQLTMILSVIFVYSIPSSPIIPYAISYVFSANSLSIQALTCMLFYLQVLSVNFLRLAVVQQVWWARFGGPMFVWTLQPVWVVCAQIQKLSAKLLLAWICISLAVAVWLFHCTGSMVLYSSWHQHRQWQGSV